MDTSKKKSSVSHYDESLFDQNSIYDNLPFRWNPDLNVEKRFTLVSGNVIKFYRCMIKEPYMLKHQ